MDEARQNSHDERRGEERLEARVMTLYMVRHTIRVETKVWGTNVWETKEDTGEHMRSEAR